MNVLVCLEHHFIQIGDQTYCRLLAPTFFQRYREVWDKVLILARVAATKEPPRDVMPLDLSGIKVIGLPDYIGALQFWRCKREIKKIARQASDQADSILFRAPGLISTVVWTQTRQTGRPFGIEVIGDPQEGFARHAVRHPLRPLIRWRLTRDLRMQCDEAYGTAYVTANRLQQVYPPHPGRFTTSYSDVELSDGQILDRPRAVFCEAGLYRLVMVGTFSQMYKGHDVLLRALSLLKSRNINFEMVFIGEGKHRPDMERLAQELELWDRTKFLGELSAGEAVRAQLDRAHLFVMPSRTEGLPRAMIEAMARGLPCIGTSVGGIPELLPPEDLVSPNSACELEEKLAQVLQDGPRMERMSRRNLETASRYRNSLTATRRIEFYQQLRAGTEAWLTTRGLHRRGEAAANSATSRTAESVRD